jgi:hypothetical protein
MLLCRVKVCFEVFEEAPDTAGDEAFEAADCLSFGLAFAGAAGGDRAAATVDTRISWSCSGRA